MTAKEVGLRLGIGGNSASRKLNQLAKYKFIKKNLKRTFIGKQFHRTYNYSLRKTK